MGEIDEVFREYWNRAARGRLESTDPAKRPRQDAATEQRERLAAAARDFDHLADVARTVGNALLDRDVPPDVAVHKTRRGLFGGIQLSSGAKAVGWLLEGYHHGGDSGHYEVDGLARSSVWVQGQPAVGSVRLLDTRLRILNCGGNDPIYEGQPIPRGARIIDRATDTVGYKDLKITEIDTEQFLANPNRQGEYSILPLLRNLAALAVDYNIDPSQLGIAPPAAEQP